MKIFLDSIGCRLNQSEIESMAAQFRRAGHEIVANVLDADLMVINTCTVTAKADADSRKRIRQAAATEKIKIVATGCYATTDPKTIELLPGVQQVIPNINKDQIAKLILGENQKDNEILKRRMPLPGSKKRTRSFIKIQDGCDNFCTFCITRVARGKSISRIPQSIMEDINFALSGDVKEIVLTGVNLGSWGKDSFDNYTLAEFIRKILQSIAPTRLRLSSLEPWDLDDDLIDVFGLQGVCRHVHLPLQSGSDEILKRMGRKTSTFEYLEIIEKIRNKSPDIAITTDIMVGFPGESQTNFQESLDFINRAKFAGGHVFSYSPRPGTPAIEFPNRVPKSVAKHRNMQMRELIKRGSFSFRKNHIGSILPVLWEKSRKIENRWMLSGFSDNYIRVEVEAGEDLYNEISMVKIIKIIDDGLSGILTD